MIILFLAISMCFSVNSYELKQVIMLGRHNIRSPLISLEEYTPHKWPQWHVPARKLTPKGAYLERLMAKYICDWLIKEKLLNDNCPSEDEVLVYGHSRERTRDTAICFAEGAFGNCVQAYYKNSTTLDPVFDLAVQNSSGTFKDLVTAKMRRQLSSIDLKEAFAELEWILDFQNSPFCQKQEICEFDKMTNQITIEANREPEVYPLKIANLVVDTFLMSYYEGMNMEDVAWGKITTIEQWKTLMRIEKAYHNLRFKTPLLDKETAKHLMTYLTDLFLRGNKKFYLLVAHDSNIHSVMSSLDFAKYDLQNQVEDSPIGGKIVFQKWYDAVNDTYLLRVHYVYQSFQQLRDGAELSQENPPEWALLKLKQYAVDENGFCPWSDFLNILNNLYLY